MTPAEIIAQFCVQIDPAAFLTDGVPNQDAIEAACDLQTMLRETNLKILSRELPEAMSNAAILAIEEGDPIALKAASVWCAVWDAA
jgi:hypothetical protein